MELKLPAQRISYGEYGTCRKQDCPAEPVGTVLVHGSIRAYCATHAKLRSEYFGRPIVALPAEDTEAEAWD